MLTIGPRGLALAGLLWAGVELSLTAPLQAEEPYPHERYGDPVSGVTLLIPKGWTVMEGEQLRQQISAEGQTMVVAFFAVDPSKVHEGMLVVDPYQNPQVVVSTAAGDSRQFVDGVLAKFQTTGGMATTHISAFQLNGRDWVRWTLLNPMELQSAPDAAKEMSAVYFEGYVTAWRGNKLIHIMLACPATAATLYQSVLGDVLGSLDEGGAEL